MGRKKCVIEVSGGELNRERIPGRNKEAGIVLKMEANSILIL